MSPIDLTVPGIFPHSFYWGAASSAFQTEGAPGVDGKGESIWDTFVRQPGRIKDGQNADVACDCYHRYNDDFRLLAQLGIRSFRYSLSWPRLCYGADPRLNIRGLDFYKRLTDSLLKYAIRPVITLYHWDLPQELEDLDGWLNRDTAYRFAEYARALTTELADHVTTWVLFKEALYRYAV